MTAPIAAQDRAAVESSDPVEVPPAPAEAPVEDAPAAEAPAAEAVPTEETN